jgi:endonuclease I
MNRYLFLVFLFAFSLNCIDAQPPSGYYSSADGLAGFALKTELKEIIDDVDDGDGSSVHVDQGYAGLWDAYQNQNSGDLDVYNTYEKDNTILDIYSENPNSTDPYNFTPGNDQCGNFQVEGDCYNREHIVPQSFFDSDSPMRNDYHSTFPTDGKVNGFRAVHPYGEVANASLTTANGSKRGTSSTAGYSGVVFEPIDEFKGDIARALFYFATRYEEQLNDSNWENPNNNFLSNDKNQFYDQWFIDVLLNWHQQDPVDQKEIDRNNNGFIHQGNRNPFVDNPDYALAIWDEDFGTEDFSNTDINFSNNPITDGRLRLTLENTNQGKLYLYNITGKLVKKFKIDNQVEVFHVNFLSSGVYIAQFKNDDQQISKKLILRN